MTTRKVANIAATKKRDNMIACGVTTGGALQEPGLPYAMTGDQTTYMFAFVPSARGVHNELPTAGNPSRGFDFSREHRSTWSVGYSERVTLTSNTGVNWRWRRIVFTMKQLEPAQAFPSGTLFNYNTSVTPNPGYVRTMWDVSQTALPRQILQQEIFQGTLGVDYSDPLNATLDRTRIRVLYDQNIAINGHNDEGHWKYRKFWHRNGRKLIYNEKESGDHKNTSEATHYNTGGREGDGDLWIVDIFASISSAGAGDVLTFLPHGTYYWHEKG